MISEGFQGQEGQKVPEMTDEIIEQISNRYIELYESFTGDHFAKADTENISLRIEENINGWINSNG